MGSSNTGGGGGGGEVMKEESTMERGGASADPSASESPAAGIFSEGENVLAYHGIFMYKAKVQKAELKEDEWKYFVHYQGWNKNWDEWVGTDRLLKYTDDNVRKQQVLAKSQSGDKNPKLGRSTQIKPKNSNDTEMDKEDLRNHGHKDREIKTVEKTWEHVVVDDQSQLHVTRGKKRKDQSSIEEKDLRSQEKLVIIQFPLTLKKQLVDDWEFVTQLGKLVKLPRSPNIDDILKKYLDYRTKKDGMVAETVVEILKGLRCYFDKALPMMLLYKKERQQYREAVGDNISPSTIYGAEHLLRLFVKLPELLAYVNMEDGALEKLQQKLLDFLKFLQKNQSSFFLSTYDGSRGKIEETDDAER